MVTVSAPQLLAEVTPGFATYAPVVLEASA
jgi:hypothetical protein